MTSVIHRASLSFLTATFFYSAHYLKNVRREVINYCNKFLILHLIVKMPSQLLDPVADLG